MLGSDEGTKLGISGGKVLENIVGNASIITLGIDVGTELGFLNGYFNGSNDDHLEDLCLEDSLGYNHGQVLGYDEGLKLGSTGGKLLGTILVKID